MRYLGERDVLATLKRDKSIEQFLGPTPGYAGYLRHIELRPGPQGFEVWVFDVEDVGSADYLDIYSFPYLEPYGPEAPLATFPEAMQAVEHASTQLSAALSRWVNQGVAQSEYEDFILRGRT